VGSTGTSAASLVLVGVSHRTAPLDVRERLHMPEDEARATASRLAAEGVEAAVLSTCNRTEIYLAAHDTALAASLARGALAARSGLPEAELEEALDERRGVDAALHLFRVAAGLDSLLPGESQILGQVREAYDVASAAGATGPVLNRTFEHALHAGKRVRSETGVGTLPAAIPVAAAALAERIVGPLRDARILVIGAGKMGALAAGSFVERGAERVFVANHRIERAEKLAERFGGVAVPWDRLVDELVRADVVLASTRCPQVIVHAEQVSAAAGSRGGRPLVLIDIAVPRDLDPAIAELDACHLYDLDALGPEAGEALAGRREEVEAAEDVVREEAVELGAWLASLEVVPIVAALRRRAEEIRTGELERAEARLERLSEEERRSVETLTAQIVSKLLHEPTVRAKEEPEHAEALRSLFDLEEGR
jgi:glutamyl-tRNA reductase